MPGSALGVHISANLTTVRRQLEAATHRARRSSDSLRLIAVSKTFPVDAVVAAAAYGQLDFGENRVQEGLDKIALTADTHLIWHLIGHLQTNKARKAAAAFQWIHSIDSMDLLCKVAAGAADAGTCPNILIQVDLAREHTKFGADVALVADIAAAAVASPSVQLRGLMTVRQSRPTRRKHDRGLPSCASFATAWWNSRFQPRRWANCPWG
jgi:PLP dependent protein